MTQELFSTSVPAGLEPGRSGFCTVAMTRNMPKPLVEMLESLSAYRPVYLPTDPRAANNPVTVSYLRVPVAGRTHNVLSRVCFAGQDYTSRSNRFAHHVVLESTDPRPPGGPAWLAARPGFLETAFDGQVRWLPAGRAVPSGEPGSPACPTWQRLTGDAGWAGVLAEALANPAERSFFLIYDPGTDILPLIQEALSLLPPERRWEATFTTYFTGLPAGVGCTLRGVLRGSAEAASASASALLDLGKLTGKSAPVNDWTAAARAGKVVVAANRFVNVPAPHLAQTGLPPSPAQLSAAAPQAAAITSPRALARPDVLALDDAPHLRHGEEPPRGVGKAIVLTLVASLIVLVGGVGTLLALRPDLLRRSHVAEKGDEDDLGTHDADKGGDPPKTSTFVARNPGLTFEGEPPAVGRKATVRVQLSFPPKAPVFPMGELRFSVEGKKVPSTPRGEGAFELVFDRAGKHKLHLEFPGDKLFEPIAKDFPVKVLQTLPPFTIEAKPARVSRGRKVEVKLVGLPKGFTALGLIQFAGLGDKGKVKGPIDGKPTFDLEDLPAGKHSIKATFPGDEVYAVDSSKPTVIQVLRKAKLVFQIPDRIEFSRGNLTLPVTVNGSDKDDPVPKGKVLLLSGKDTLDEPPLDDKGKVVFTRKDLFVKSYDLSLRFVPAGDEWESIEEKLPGPWRVVETVKLLIKLEEMGDAESQKFKVRFKAPESKTDIEFTELPSGKPYYLVFLPHKSLKLSGVLQHTFSLGDTGTPKLNIRWTPDNKSWGKAKPLHKPPAFPVITFIIAEPAKDKKGVVKYSLVNTFPPPGRNDPFAYRPLVDAYREVVRSLHGSEIEVYEGVDHKEKAKGDEKGKTVRDQKGKFPLLRFKILDP